MTLEEVYKLYHGRDLKNKVVDKLTGVSEIAVVNLPDGTEKLRGVSN